MGPGPPVPPITVLPHEIRYPGVPQLSHYNSLNVPSYTLCPFPSFSSQSLELFIVTDRQQL